MLAITQSVGTFTSVRIPSHAGGLPVEVSLLAQMGIGQGDALIADALCRQQGHEAFVDELDEPRNVVVRLHLSGYHRDEIAQLLGWTEPKVRNLLYRGLEDLRALLLARGIGPRHIA